jgi:IS1 family transposase/transposase-like protein
MLFQMVLMVILVLVGVNYCLGQWSSGPTVLPTSRPVHSTLAGRTCQPDCPACQAEVGQAKVTPPPRPAPRQKKKAGRPRCVQTDWHFCPHRGCSHYGWVGLGNIVANGHPNGGRFRQLHCTVCGKYFAESTGTIFYRSPLAPELLSRIIKALAEGVNLHATARIFEVDPNTVKACLVKAAEHMEAVSSYLIHDLELTQVQVDELWALLQEGDTPQAASAQRHPHAWVWAAIDPVSKLLVATIVGDRSLVSAQRLIHAVVLTLAPGVVPLFLSDQLVHYATALLTHFGHWVTVPRRAARGPQPKPRWEPLPELNYAQVVKHRVKGRVIAVTTRVIFGSAQAIRASLKSMGHTINTAFIERVNLTLRSHLPALARKTLSFAKSQEGLRQQVSLGQTYYNFCLPHFALRLALPAPRPTKGSGSPQRWHNRTPAMAAGLTRHLWTMQELLLYRVPPWRQEVLG